MKLSTVLHEIYQLFENHCDEFTTDEIAKALRWIEEAGAKTQDENDINNIEKIEAYRKRCWLHSLLKSSDKRILEAYDRYGEINPAEPEHPGLLWYSSSEYVTDKSPIETDNIMKMSNQEIAEYLWKFKESGNWGDPTIEGLEGHLRECVISNPDKFIQDTSPFVNVPKWYQYALLRGFEGAIQKGKYVSFHSFIQYGLEIVKSKVFWGDEGSLKRFDYRESICSAIVNVIEHMVQNKDKELAIDELELAKILLLDIAEKIKGKELSDDNIRNCACIIYSAKGVVFSVLMKIAILIGKRLQPKDHSRWDNNLREHFQRHLDPGNESSAEYPLSYGRYLPNSSGWKKDGWRITETH